MAKEPEEESTLDTVRDLKHREPFLPFLVVMASGGRYLIEDPEALAMAGSQLHYYPPRSGKAIHIRVSQISAVEEFGEKQSA
jgi:hypothetical protein